MNRKEKLIKSLMGAIRALENGTVTYNWQHQHSCNCGVVSQAMLGITGTELKQRLKDEEIFKHEIFAKVKDEPEVSKTWKNLISAWCPITGVPMKQIFDDLNDAGLTTDDIAHLEYLENPAILNRSGISTHHKVTTEVFDHYDYIPVNTFFGRLFGRTKMVEVKKTVTTTTQDHNYYSKIKNVILYLKAWVSILQEEREPIQEDLSGESKQELQERLLIAVADENYEMAAKLRDELVVSH
jgi:hypothetical protein